MTNTLELQLHYFLNVEGLHSMDAHTLLECEQSFVSALDNIKECIGEFQINVKAREEGGVVDMFQLVWNDPTIKSVGLLFVGAFINHWFSKKRDSVATSLTTLDLIKKIKEGDYTEEEATIAIDNNKKLQKWKSDYYASLEKAPNVVKVDVLTKDDNNKCLINSSISRADFMGHIINEEITETSRTIESTTIGIVSPVLSGQGKIWTGVYSATNIKFKIEDKDFIKQVHNNEIKFGSNTIIRCRLKITETYKEDELYGDPEYSVLYVSHWADDETFQFETKKFKRIKADERQLSFNFPEND